ncbi:MAG TPA: TIGR03617 family F420-dependent LLM class oxidoreductase [Dehalococcoidia bacterium]|nr:TIGR03617 family F420-dependent LLM class oxidoreductase [Dehalococcoidia bacterium]
MRVESGFRTGDLATVPAEARRLERLGYDAANTPETQHNPFLPLVLAAEHTERLHLGTAVAIAFARSPMVVANTFWDLQAYSRGRMSIGLGSQVKGHNIRRFSVPWSPPAPRMREYVLALRAIFDTFQNGVPLDFQGQHYQFTLMTPNFNPGPIDHPRIPIYISAVGKVMARVAGEVCDGVRIHGFTTRRYTEEVLFPAFEEGRRRSGRSLADFDISGGGFIVSGRTQAEVEQAREATRRQVAFYASTRTYQAVLELHGWADVCTQLHEMVAQGRWSELHTLITDDILDEFAVFGTYDEIVPKVQARYEGLCDSIAFGPTPRTAGEEDRIRETIAGLKTIRTRRDAVQAA